MKDAKHIHREQQLNRPADHWQDGWPRRAESWAHGFMWGAIALIAFSLACPWLWL